MFTRIVNLLGLLYLMRVPILVWMAMLGLWYGFLSGSGAEPILRGIFDVSRPDDSFAACTTQFAFVTLAALLLGTAVLVPARLIVRNSNRFGLTPVYAEFRLGIELLLRLPPLVAAAALVGSALYLSQANWAGKIAGVVAGIAAWWLLTIKAQDYLFARNWRILNWIKSGVWVLGDKTGYMRTDPYQLYERQTFAVYQFVLSFLAFVAAAFKHILRQGDEPLIPTLSLVLLLMMLACWGLAGMAFFLDRYRVPLISVVVIVAAIAGLSRQSDYYYEGIPRTRPALPKAALRGSELLRLNGPADPVILVATTGGGIQAAGWTARVLMGLERSIGSDFARHVRLVSSVSGGSVGAMYFLAQYQNGALPSDAASLDAEPAVVAAQASSLDQITWGLAYPDLGFGFFPLVKGIGKDADGDWHVTDGGAIYFDRGLMLEDSWTHHVPGRQSEAQLMDWRKDAANRSRPAVIFNSTLVETGQRLLLATTDFDPTPQDQSAGRFEFMTEYPELDLRVRTAARLSATFPYVSPATRLLVNVSEPGKHLREGGFHDRSIPHAADGGYYDNYGMTTLLDWLHAAFQTMAPGARPPVMIVQIRSSPTEKDTGNLQTSFGFWFQLAHPVETLWNVRGTGQLSHNQMDLDLVDHLYDNVCPAVFEFSETDAEGCPRTEPLNWHLTPDDIAALRDAWTKPGIAPQIEKVRTFLKTRRCPRG